MEYVLVSMLTYKRISYVVIIIIIIIFVICLAHSRQEQIRKSEIENDNDRIDHENSQKANTSGIY